MWESCVSRPDESRSNLAIGMQWASRVTSVGLEFVVPPLLGHLADRRLGTSPLVLLIGSVVGFALGMMHILRFAREGTGGGSGPSVK